MNDAIPPRPRLRLRLNVKKKDESSESRVDRFRTMHGCTHRGWKPRLPRLFQPHNNDKKKDEIYHRFTVPLRPLSSLLVESPKWSYFSEVASKVVLYKNYTRLNFPPKIPR